MDFDQRLEKAVARGKRTRDARGQADAEKALSESELRTLHSKCRLELSEHIEKCLHKVADQFPGFDYETLVSDGWGARIQRDDVEMEAGTATNFYTRLEMVVRPFSDTHIVALAVKGTIRNKEVISREHFQFLSHVDLDSLSETLDLWVLEFAEKYAAG